MNSLSRREREKKGREAEIIAAAEKIFHLKGFEDTSVDEIAKEAQFTKRTLYQYFTSKEELYFAVVQRGFQRLRSYLLAADQNEVSGYQKVNQLAMACYRFYQDDPAVFQLLGSVGHAKQTNPQGSQWQRDFMAINDELFHMLSRVIGKGQADGSIQPDLDAEKTSFSLIFLMTGLFSQLASSGKSFSAYYSLDQTTFEQFTLNLLLSTIRKQSF